MRRLALTVGGLLLGAALAGYGAAAETSPAARAGEVEVVGGGIGTDEQQSLIAREKEFNLKLVFTLVQGNYVADVNVVVRDARGETIVERQGEGPLLLARLPAGDYTVTATHDGRTLTRKVKLSASRLRTEYLRWPADPKEDLPVSRWLEKE